MTLLVKGTHVAFDMADGGETVLRASAGMMHDPSGHSWPRCSLLVGPYRIIDADEPDDEQARSYFGRQHRLREAVVDRPPPRDRTGWRRLGPVEQIYYTRPGSRYRGRFRHPFNAPGIMTRIFKGNGIRPVLYAHHSFLRLEMSRGCLLDARGIVWP
jgi:hypothetical protein